MDSALDVELPCALDPDMWFAPPGSAAERRAIVLCGGCRLRPRCAELGETEPFGVWGGVSSRDRDAVMPPWYDGLDHQDIATRCAETSYVAVSRILGVNDKTLRAWVLGKYIHATRDIPSYA